MKVKIPDEIKDEILSQDQSTEKWWEVLSLVN